MIFKLVGLHLKQSTGRSQKKIAEYILPAIFLMASLAVIVVSLYYSGKAFDKLRFGTEYITISIFILQLIMIVYNIVATIKQLYMSNDSLLFLKLPIKKIDIYLSKIIFILLNQYILCFGYLLVTAGMFGMIAEYGGVYFAKLFLISIIITAFSMGAGGILSVPVLYIISFLKRHNILKLIVIAACVAVFFTFYIKIMNGFISVIDATRDKNYLNPALVNEIKDTAGIFVYSHLFSDILFGTRPALSYGITIPLAGILITLSFFIAKYKYFKIQSEALENNIKSTKKDVPVLKPALALLRREYLLIFRSDYESLSFISTALTMPIMVYMTTKVVAVSGTADIGGNIVFGICVLTLAVFIVISNSACASTVSRDGQAAYTMHILPYSVKKQLLIKLVANSVVTVIPFVISEIVLVATGYLTVSQFFATLFLLLIFIVVEGFMAVMNDYKSPEYSEYSKGNEGGKNTLFSTLIGLVVAIIIGLLAILLPFVLSNPEVSYAALYGVVILYAVIVAIVNRGFFRRVQR
ncbi:MAG: hypothetical protein MJ068_03485 [Clostridia bacterium]|nr:hypothetical protein [Clostridia bacterium]